MLYSEALSKLARLCSRSEKCEYDVRSKIQQWGLSGDEEDKLVTYLVAEKYVDNERYCRIFVRSKFAYNQWGRIKITFQLRQKKFEDAFVNRIIEEELDEKVYIDTLVDLLRAKDKKIKETTAWERKAKLLRYAQSKGFTYEEVSTALSQLEIQ